MLHDNNNRFAISQNVDEKLFRLLVASVKDYAIYLIDTNGHVMTWNQGAEYITGYTDEEIIGQHVSIFYTQNDIQKSEPRSHLNKALKNNIYEDEGWRLRKGGDIFWANVVLTTLYNDKGHLTGFAVVVRDNTERKKNEDNKSALNIELEKRVKENTKKAIASERKFRKLIENSYDGIYLLDKNLDIFYRSLSSERINGWSNTAASEYDLAKMIHPDDEAVVRRMWKEILAKPGVPYFLTYRTKHKQGHFIWVECIFNNMLHDKDINAIVCNFRNVTEKKAAEEEIRKKTEQVEDILESITDGFIALDNNLCYTYANKKIGEMLGIKPEKLIGRCVWDVFPEAVNSATYHAFNKALASRQYISHEDYYEPLHLWQENHIYPSPSGLSVFIRNVSERKKAELEILQLNETLEKKVVERTLQLEEVNKELESFSYSVSHDLRTPLRAINGYAMMLKEDFEGKLGDEGNRIINTITNNARLMGQLIDDLLAFSRLGRKALVFYTVDMHALVKSCVRELLENEPINYDITLQELPPCEADPGMTKHIWMNLIGNAIKYSAKAAKPIIEIGFIDEGEDVTYFVKDNGVGFDMQYSNKLFGVFQRLHRSGEFEGTGVGLALVKRIIDKHNGTIWADALPGKGAAFYFRLPHTKQI
ncbi:MAG: PAS domain S-box protein [Sphingobacteriaceae bacterium]|nr:MAG: PAS domain S-box protein [Sphingobacteriaceae bacterium]